MYQGSMRDDKSLTKSESNKRTSTVAMWAFVESTNLLLIKTRELQKEIKWYFQKGREQTGLPSRRISFKSSSLERGRKSSI